VHHVDLGNLGPSVGHAELRVLFPGCAGAKVVRGYGFVRFPDAVGAAAARKLDGSRVHGRRLTVSPADKSTQKSLGSWRGPAEEKKNTRRRQLLSPIAGAATTRSPPPPDRVVEAVTPWTLASCAAVDAWRESSHVTASTLYDANRVKRQADVREEGAVLLCVDLDELCAARTVRWIRDGGGGGDDDDAVQDCDCDVVRVNRDEGTLQKLTAAAWPFRLLASVFDLHRDDHGPPPPPPECALREPPAPRPSHPASPSCTDCPSLTCEREHLLMSGRRRRRDLDPSIHAPSVRRGKKERRSRSAPAPPPRLFQQK